MAASRLVHALSAAVVVAATLLLPGAAASAAEVTEVHRGSESVPAVRTDVDDFSYARWDAQYDVARDADGRARLHVTESLTARFPDADQNKGIVRGLPMSYEGAWLDVRVTSVTDENGADVPWETDEDDGVLYVLTGDDDYVRGLTTYVIEYEMRDVVLAADTGVDEFYWDLLPLDSTQPIESFHADIRLDDALRDALTGEARCYIGVSGSTDECALTGGDGAFAVTAEGLAAGEGVTVAIGFDGGTVTQPDARRPNPVTDTVPAVAALGALGISVASWIAVSATARSRRAASGIVVAQYDVPGSLPPLLAAALLPRAKAVIPAQIVHLAVNGALRIEEEAADHPRLRRLPDRATNDPLDEKAVDALFVGADRDGVVDLPSESESFAARMTALERSGVDAAAAQGLTAKVRSRAAMFLQTIAIIVALCGFGLGLWGLLAGRVSAIPAFVAMCFGLFLVLVSSFYSFSRHTVLTAEGARSHEYLLGVKEFIRVAEADRLQMLQSYSGAERRADGTVDVIVVYEHLLPYAMLFGMEDEWGRVLEQAYAHAQRGAAWIGDPASPFLRSQIAAFAVTSAASASYSAPSASSSSSFGGSAGGGFSGGGGGGGFSGGR